MGNIISSFLDVFTNPNFYANVLAVTPPILLAALVVFTMAGCTPKDKYEIAVVTDVGQLMDGGSGYL